MDWQPYDPAWLVEWLRKARPEYESLAAALSRRRRAWQDFESDAHYGTSVYHFVDRSEFVRFFRLAFLDHTPKGPVLLSIQDDEEIGSLQFLDEEMAESSRRGPGAPLDLGDIHYSTEQIRSWVPRLRYFRLCQVHRGEPYCTFRVWIRYVTQVELLELAQEIGFPIDPVPPDNRRPVPNLPVPPDFEFETPIEHLPHLAQPGWTYISGQKAFVWVRAGEFRIEVGDPENQWYVSDAACDSALVIEGRLAGLADRILECPPQECVTPEGHPWFWEDA